MRMLYDIYIGGRIMSEQKNYNRYEDEIDLRELFMVLWKGKKFIVSITLILAVLSGIITMFFIDPVYEAKLDILANFPEIVNTKYGEYKMLMTTNEQYVNLIHSNDVLKATMQDVNYDISKSSIENLLSGISVIKDDKKPNSFTIKVKAETPDDALKIASNLYKNYINFLNSMIKSRSVEYFSDYYSIELRKNEDELTSNTILLEQYKKMLDQIPQTINQKDALESIDIGSVDYVVLENIINENYKKVELDIINLEQVIYNLENKINLSKQYLNELDQIRDSIASNDELAKEYFKVINTSIQLPSEPVAPNNKISPSTSLNVIIGAVIGGIISVIYVLIKKYWFTEVK